MHLAVFGANGPTGRLVVRQALDLGHHVTAVTRKPDQFPISSPHLDVAGADVVDVEAVDRVLSTGAYAVISTYGVPYSRADITVFSEGITNITEAMVSHGVTRLVCVTSTTVGTEKSPGESRFGRIIIYPLLRNVIGRTLYDDMQRMETIVRSSTLDWTIVRPGGLFDADEPTDDYEMAPAPIAGFVTSRADLAQALIREATDPRHQREVVEVITRSGTPSGWTFVKEALGMQK